MSLKPETIFKLYSRVPRASGDEPLTTPTHDNVCLCSPRERG